MVGLRNVQTALRARIVELSAALGAVCRRVFTIPEIRTVFIRVADIAVVFTSTTMTRQAVGIPITLLGVDAACLALVADVATALPETILVFREAASCNLSECFVVRIAVWVAALPVSLFTGTAYAPDRSILLLAAASLTWAIRVFLAVARSSSTALAVACAAANVSLITWRPGYRVIPAGVGPVVTAVSCPNLGTLAIDAGHTRTAIFTAIATVVLPTPPDVIVTGKH